MSDLAIKQSLLKQAFPQLKDDVVEQLAQAAILKNYAPQMILCREHNHEETFYIIQSGEVFFSKKMGLEEHVFRKSGAGEYFGEMALLDDSTGRSATVTTSQPTTVLEINREMFDKLITSTPSLLLDLIRIVIKRMRQNDRQAIDELQIQKQAIEKAYNDLQKLDQQRHIFLTTLAHELRTPLTSVTGYMQLIRGGHLVGGALQMSLEKMGSNLDRMVSLINDLFFLQEMDILDPHFRRIQLADILDEVILKCQGKAEQHNLIFVQDVDPLLPEIQGETDGLMRALWHLVDNAVKFSPEGGEVFITAHAEDEVVEIVIKDSGIGIDPNYMPHIFERFVRDEQYNGRLFDGMGLGMPIVKQIVDMHNGTIVIDSIRGEGTTITVCLPLDARRATVEMSIDDAWVDVPE